MLTAIRFGVEVYADAVAGEERAGSVVKAIRPSPQPLPAVTNVMTGNTALLVLGALMLPVLDLRLGAPLPRAVAASGPARTTLDDLSWRRAGTSLVVHRSVRARGGTRDGWRMTAGAAVVRMVDMDPELEAFIPFFPEADLSDPVAARRKFAELAAAVPAPDTTGLVVEDRTVPAEPDVPVRIYRPHEALGAIVWLHGGGFVMGDLDTEHPWAARIAALSGVVVISVDYRLAPEHRFPAALDDTYAVLVWAAKHATELGVDPERIAVGGHSAGACLAAAVALRARDEQGPSIRYQLLNQPGLDDRQQTWSQRNFTDTPWMNRDKVTAMWRHYLDGEPATPYAAPARAADLSRLPPAYVASAELCPNRDEDIEYARRLLRAGVSVELHQWAGAFHGSQAILSAEISQRQAVELGAALRRALAG